jgi:DNA-binding transcriptional MerR regulator
MTQPRSQAASRPRKIHAPVDPSAVGAIDRALKIGEAARLLGVEAYVLRFWETQFPFLRPKHTRSKHRFYEHRDLETLMLVKRLLHTEGYTIAGAKKHIRERGLDKLLLDESSVPESETATAEKESEPAMTGAPRPAIEDSVTSATLDSSVQRRLAEIREDLRSLHRMLASQARA